MSERGKRLLQALSRLILQLCLVVLLAWALLAMSPLDPINGYLGGNLFGLSVEQRAQLVHRLGLDQSVATRLWQWFSALLQGNWGFSNLYRQPVAEVIRQRLPVSLLLLGLSWLVSLLLGYLLGLYAALKQHRWQDRLLRRLAWMLAAIPSFWLGMIFISVFAVGLHWLPVCCAAPIGVTFSEQTFWQFIRHFTLPVLTLSLVHMAPVLLHTREKVLDVLASDYVAYSRQHGDSDGTIIRFHVIKNSLLPAVVLQFGSVAELFGGSLLAETLFAFPGLGQALVKAALAQDTALLMGGTLISALLVFAGNAMANILSETLMPGRRSQQ